MKNILIVNIPISPSHKLDLSKYKKLYSKSKKVILKDRERLINQMRGAQNHTTGENKCSTETHPGMTFIIHHPRQFQQLACLNLKLLDE